MLKLFIAAVVVAVVAADLDTDWIIFKTKYNKKYGSEEDVARKYIWTENMNYVEEHNKLYSRGLSTYVLGENEYADMTNSEFVAKMNGVKLNVNEPPVKYVNNTKNLPDSVDWRTEGYVTPIKNQGQCGSCWSFSTTGAIEGQHFKSTGKLVSLSESNLVDCSGAYDNQGCNGGYPYRAFQYVIARKGIDTEGSYPYQPVARLCHFSASNIGATISSYKEIPRGSESALQEAVADVGPISVCIDATHTSFQMYRAGVYYERECSSTKLDHAVLAVGYGTEDNQAYWLVKNSWGTTWGMEGYIKMARNQDNNCGIATQAAYPLV